MSSILNLSQGDFVRPTTTVNLRRSPGYVGQPASDVVTPVTPGDLLRVLSSQVRNVDGLAWWNVEIVSGGRVGAGWVAETTPGTGTPLLARVEPPAQSGLAVGMTVRTTAAINMRQTPGFQNQPASDIVATLPQGTQVQLVEGPRFADGLTWWRGQTSVSGSTVVGWVAESTPAGVPLLERVRDLQPPPPAPPPPAPPPQPGLQPGGGAMTQTVVRLRQSPGHVGKPATDTITDVPPNTQIRVVAGPRSVDGLTWWQVEAPVGGRVLTGWMAETAPNGILLLRPAPAPVEPFPPPAADFSVGEILVTAVSVRVRRSPGHLGAPPEDVLGTFWPGMAFLLRGAPQEADGLVWWTGRGITASGDAVTGWVAQRLGDGTPLIMRPRSLPGTNIPSPGQNRYLGAPFRGQRPISQLFGRNPQLYGQYVYDGVPLRGHNGIDFSMPIGTELLAVESGTVVQVAYDAKGYGHYVVIQHPWGQSLYAHMAGVPVQPGQSVARGQFIGPSGNTGASTGPHLHFAIRINPYQRGDGWGGFAEPLPYLNPNDYILPGYMQREATLAPRAVPADALIADLPPTPLAPEETAVSRP
jgi:hypothetical protein